MSLAVSSNASLANPGKLRHYRKLSRCLSLAEWFVSVTVMTQASARNPFRAALRLQGEGGLLLVILLLGLMLSIFGGTVERRVGFTTNADGEKIPVMEKQNKFCNTRTLAQLAKDTSFIAIMSVGATFVIISGGIDLSVGAIYALASVLGAMVFHRYGPDGSSPGGAGGIIAGLLVCLGVGAGAGLLNGAMIVALKVHPFIITLGTMAILRGIAFVITKGQSIGGFPQGFRDMVLWGVNDLSLMPLIVMVVVAVIGGIYLTRLAAGRRIYAIGGNELASRYSGIRVEWVKLSVFLFPA